MSLESKIQELTEAVSRLIDALNAPLPIVAPAPAPVQAVAPVPLAPPVAAAPVSVTPANPVSSQPTAPAMPAPPAFVAPAPAAAPVAGGAPFTDGKGLIDYVMGAYKSMGPAKGSRIQEVMSGLGYQNINDIKPEHYAALYAGVEALKG